MDSSSMSMTVAIICLITMSAYFSATETAFSSYNRIRVKNMAEDGNKRAALVLSMSESYDRLLSTILIGNNIVNITATTISAVLFTKLLGEGRGPTVSTIVLTVVVLIFGEVSPKSIAKEHPEKFAMFSAPLLRFLMVILLPLNSLFTLWKKLLNLIFKPSEDNGITEEELITMVEEAESDGELDEHESELIRSAIEFGDLTAGDIFTPRVDIIALPDDATMEEAAVLFTESGYSRLPVYHGTVDNIIGVIHEEDFYSSRYRGHNSFSDFISPIHYTTANIPVDELLRTLQRQKSHMAIIVDEFGGTEGLITMEDIIEELVGDIWDEHDEVEEAFRRQEDGSYIVSCSATLHDLYDLFSLRGDCEASTVSGWVIECMSRLPEVGDHFQAEGLDVAVTKVDQRRVLEIQVTRMAEEPVGK